MAAKKKTAPKPFVVDMRHDELSEPHYGVASTWDGAIEIAADYWRDHDGEYDPKQKQPWRAGEGYEQESITVTQRKGVYLCVDFCDGPFIQIKRAETIRC